MKRRPVPSWPRFDSATGERGRVSAEDTREARVLTRRDALVLEEGPISRGDPVLQLTFVGLFTCMCHSKGPASKI